MADFVDRKIELGRYFPKPFYDLKPGKGISIILEIMGGELNTLDTDTQAARAQYLLASAEAQYLVDHGVNRDVFKPSGYRMTDTVYRQLIEIVTNSSKNIEHIFERIIALYFGPDAIARGVADVYSVRPNQIIVDLKANALIVASSRDLYGTWFIHETDASGAVPVVAWSGTLDSDANIGDMSVTFMSLPVGVPDYGIMVFGTSALPIEQKIFKLSGSTLDFFSPLKLAHAAGTAVEGSQDPDDFHSGYVYDAQTKTQLVGAFSAGATSILVSASADIQKFPLEGVIYIGAPGAVDFEAKGFTRSTLTSTTFVLMGGLENAHSSGEDIVQPNFFRNIRTTLSGSITAGSSHSTIPVVNGADFPIKQGAICLANSFGNKELVPFRGRVIANNTILDIDPGYIFQFNHASTEKVQLMALKTTPSNYGLNWPAYVDDVEALRNQFFALMKRLKATGVKIVFELQ